MPQQAPTGKTLGPQLPPHLFKRKVEEEKSVDNHKQTDQDLRQAGDSSDDDDAIGPSLKVRKVGDSNKVK